MNKGTNIQLSFLPKIKARLSRNEHQPNCLKLAGRSLFYLLIAALCIANEGMAQGSESYGNGLKVNLDSSGNRYVRIMMWSHFWVRTGQQNPGTFINNQPANSNWDIGARRIRMLAYAQISPRYLILLHYGINNQTFANGGATGSGGTGGSGLGKKPQLFFHDVWNEYAIKPLNHPITGKRNKYSLYLGAGLHYWWGISRMTAASTLNFLAVDAPLINWPLVETGDQFGRQLGTYVKGKWGKLNYSLAMNKPFATNLLPGDPDPVKGPVAVDNNGTGKPAFTGYFDYQFLGQESNLLPFRVGSYLGTKKVFNIGAGFYTQANATLSKTIVGGTEALLHHPIQLFGADVFTDLPFGNKQNRMAFTGYSVFYHYDFGPNYLRTLGVMNPATSFNPSLPDAQKTLNGPGNSRMFIGTGNMWYTQAGLLLPKWKTDKVRLQPFTAYTYKKLKALDEPGHYFDAGANILLDGQNAKITAQYSSRPLYYNRDGLKKIDGHKGEYILQFQIYL